MFTQLLELDNIEIESNILKEYINFKNENPDYIVMFQIGAFFETFFEDAKTFSEITGAQYTSRMFKNKISVAESGVNKNSINSFIKKLLLEGEKVCVCQEFSDECGKHYREVARKYTPGTILEDEFLESSENNFLMAIYYKDDYYNISYADVSTGQIYKTKAGDKEYKIETEKISPNEILISKNQEKYFKNLISKYNATFLDDNYFESSVEDAIYKYCNITQKKYKSSLDKIIEYKCTSYMMLDEMTRKNLELTRTNYLSKKRGSILWFLNYTKTPMGIRLLKRFLSAPLLSENDINQRLEAVEELVENPKLLDKMQDLLSQFSDLSRLCSRISNITVLPKDLVNLSRNSMLLIELKQLILNLNSKLYKINSKKLDKVLALANTIGTAIKKDCLNELKSGNIINDGYNAELDFRKNELNEYKKEIDKYFASQKRKLEISSLKINYSSAIGYYFEVPSQYALKMPKEFLKKNSTNKLIRYTTNELDRLQENINSKQFEINNLEYEIFKKIRVSASNFVESIRSLAKDIALIDVLASFARSAVENNLTKPEISGKDIIIKDGYHPSLLKLNNEIIKNDTNLKYGSMSILTGANMSGKSTYLKHNAIICILAQIGSYIPASSANIPITDKIFFRQSSTDDIINNNSSFMVEMNDLKYILDNITNSSLILLDEPAKSTNAQESGAIARAFCEYILNNYYSKTIVATHNLELTKLEDKYPSKVANYIMGSSNNGVFDRKIRRGVIEKSYALDTAILAELPDEILTLAKSYN